MKNILILSLMISFPFFGSCATQKPVTNDDESKPIVLDEHETTYAAAGNDFTFRFLSQIDSVEQKDWFVSPLSLQFLLGMVLDGADGATADEICQTLGYPAGETEAIDAYCRKMLSELPRRDKATKLTLANAIFFNKQMEIRPSYRKRVEKAYDAEIESLDFKNKDKTLGIINGWCDKKTNGLIPSVLSDVDPDMLAYLLNALYFKGTWMYPFNKRSTQEETFYLESGETKQVPMMKKERKFSYSENEICQRVRLPYGEGAFTMYVLLPKKGHSVADIIASLDADSWKDLRKRMYSDTKINLWLPPFETRYHIRLNDILCDMGMPTAFSKMADFKEMSKDALWLDFVQQDAVIKVDEEGSEAAAVTVGGMMGATAIPEPPKVIDFHADHPFLYMIVEGNTGSILFAGKYTGK